MRGLAAMILTSALALAAAPPAARGESLGSAEEVLAEIDSKGASAVRSRLWDADEFEALSKQVQTGDRRWLLVAQRLRAETDAHASETLDNAVALALPAAPTAVLEMIDHGFALRGICTSPFFEPEPGEAEAYEKRALAALQGVTDPALRSLADECAAQVKLEPAP